MNTTTTSSTPASDRLVVHAGHLLTMDPTIPDGPGTIVVHDGTIVAVGANVAPELCEGAEIIDAAGDIVMPGLVDTHRHTWQAAIRHIGMNWSLDDYFGNVLFQLAPQYRPIDAWSGNLLGALGALESGVTTLVDWSHIQSSPEHSDACIDALRLSGIRAVFAYGWPQDQPARWVGESNAALPDDIRRVRDVLSDDRDLVTMAMAARGPELATFEATAIDIALARELDLAVTMHVGAGAYGPKYRAVEHLAAAGLLDERTTLVHACTCSDHELHLAAAAGATASVSPMIEMTMDGLGASPTGRLLDAGVRTGVSSDSEVAVSGDLFTQLRAAHAQHQMLRRFDHDLAGRAQITPMGLLRMATIDGARVAGVAERTGSLTPGKRADLITITANTPALAPVNDPAQAIVTAAHPGLVRTVIVDGAIVKRDGRMTIDVDTAITAAGATLDHLRCVAPGVVGTRPHK